MTTNSIIHISDLSFSYVQKEMVLKDISFNMPRGSLLGVIGPNGGGKTTLMNLLIGLLPWQTGTYLLAGQEVDHKHFPFHHFAYLPQIHQLNKLIPLKVSELLLMEISKQRDKKKAQEQVEQMLVKMDITHLSNRYIRELSGGETQKVHLAKAFIKEPQVLILDEPSNTLDSKGVDSLTTTIKELVIQKNLCAIIVDHNINQVLKHCDRILCLNKNHHWHDEGHKLTSEVLESIYHCEFEHLLIHELAPHKGHRPCESDHMAHHHDAKKERS